MDKTKRIKKLKEIPSKPGVYLFFNIAKELIYIGKATSLKSRVRSYFSGQKTPRPIEEMLHEVENIKWEETDSVLEAIILEAKYIKKFQPKYNVLGKDDKSWNYLVITKEKFPRLEAIREHDLTKSLLISKSPNLKIQRLNGQPIDKRFVFGPFPGLNTTAVLKILRQIFKFSTCKENQKKTCFYYQIHQCLGVCTNEISADDYKKVVVKPMVMFLQGKKKTLLRDLNKRMKIASKNENFEEAKRLRDQIFNLNKIQDFTLLNKSFLEIGQEKSEQENIRIEGYDISNLGPTGMVGSMVVFENNEAQKSAYRKFKIKTVSGQSDVDCLAEIFERRLNHDAWPLPYLFLIDGGKPQVNKIYAIARARGLNIPVVGLAKGRERKRNDLVIENANLEQQQWIHRNLSVLIRLRDEAHRFAINYQRSLRKIS
jgi:excinuclease ABC subunit C